MRRVARPSGGWLVLQLRTSKGRAPEDLLRDAWLKGVADGRMDEALDRFGEELERARETYDDIKQSDTIIDRLVPHSAAAAAAAATAQEQA